jgi:hypothetical protein
MVGCSDATSVLCILTLVVSVSIMPTMHMFALSARAPTPSPTDIQYDQVQCKTSTHGLSPGSETVYATEQHSSHDAFSISYNLAMLLEHLPSFRKACITLTAFFIFASIANSECLFRRHILSHSLQFVASALFFLPTPQGG